MPGQEDPRGSPSVSSRDETTGQSRRPRSGRRHAPPASGSGVAPGPDFAPLVDEELAVGSVAGSVAVSPLVAKRKWIAPMVLFLVCFFLQNAGLYVGTYYYVHWMDRLNNSMSRHHTANSTMGTGDHLSSSIVQGSLHDVASNFFGRHDIDTSFLDTLSAAVTVVWVLATILKQDLQLWTRCCLCGSLLALLKGFLAWATVVPDSIGWQFCKERLGADGVEYFRKSGLHFETDLLESVGDILSLELMGLSRNGSTKHLRFCADMLFSGHTYFITLFSLGLYDLVHRMTSTAGQAKQVVVRFLLGTFLAALVISDVVMILMKRFHYTMDVVIALVLVLLFYSNTAVAIVADWWTSEVNGKFPRLRSPVEDEQGDLLVPPCCFPFCCIQGRFHFHGGNPQKRHEEMAALKADANLSKAEKGELLGQFNQLKLVSERTAQQKAEMQRKWKEERDAWQAELVELQNRSTKEKSVMTATIAEERTGRLRAEQDLCRMEEQIQHERADGERRLNEEVSRMDARMQLERQMAMRMEDKVAGEHRRIVQLESTMKTQLAEEIGRMETKLQVERQVAMRLEDKVASEAHRVAMEGSSSDDRRAQELLRERDALIQERDSMEKDKLQVEARVSDLEAQVAREQKVSQQLRRELSHIDSQRSSPDKPAEDPDPA